VSIHSQDTQVEGSSWCRTLCSSDVMQLNSLSTM